MTRAARAALFWVSAAAIAAGLLWSGLALPRIGTADHPYGSRAVAASLARRTANAVSSVNFDQRALDTLGEESILFAAVLGSVVLLRQVRGERRTHARAGYVLPATRLLGLGLAPVTAVTGVYVVAHGALTPGGGFQGGVVLATGLHVAYVALDYRALRRVRPLAVLEVAEALAAGAFAALGLLGFTAAAGSYLRNVLPLGTFNDLVSAGLVPAFNTAVGVEVASGISVVLSQFLFQAVEMEETDGA